MIEISDKPGEEEAEPAFKVSTFLMFYFSFIAFQIHRAVGLENITQAFKIFEFRM